MSAAAVTGPLKVYIWIRVTRLTDGHQRAAICMFWFEKQNNKNILKYKYNYYHYNSI